jgi:5-bromo-4-chloroindolyl phosphate hydrolysis protein
MLLTLQEKTAQSLIDALLDACRQKETDNFILKSELEGAKREIDRLQKLVEKQEKQIDGLQFVVDTADLPTRAEVSE